MRASKRWQPAIKAFKQVTPCEEFPALSGAALQEVRMIEGYLRDKNKRSKDGGSASGGAAAAAAETTIDSNTTKKVLLLTFHDGVAASVRWAASQLKWDLDVPDLHEDAANDGGGAGGNGEGWLGGCEDAASNRVSIDELGVPWAAAASFDPSSVEGAQPRAVASVVD